MTVFVAPSAAINIIRARSAVACPVERRRTKDSSSSRSATDKKIETAALPRAPSHRCLHHQGAEL